MRFGSEANQMMWFG